MPHARRALATTLALVAGVVALLTLLTVAAGPASAHATLIGTDPAEGEVLPTAPEQVTFTFDEAVSLTSDAVAMFDAAGESVEVEASGSGEELVAVLPDLEDGTYVVTYRVVSADGHPIAGSLSFSVGAPSETVVAPGVDLDASPPTSTSVALGVVSGLAYLGLLLAAGLVLFTTRLLGSVRLPATASGRLAGVLRLATAVAVVAWVLRVPVVGAYQQGAGPLALLGEAPDLGLLAEDLLVTGVVVAGLLVALLARPAPLRLAAAGLALAAPALVGHTRAFDPVPLLVATDVVHLTAGATWLGGLVALALTLPALAGRPADAAAVLARFSGWAAGALGLVAVTGSLLGWRILGSWSALTGTAYGRVLLVKVGVVALVAVLAGFNRWRLLPRTRAAVGHAEQQRATGVVRTAVRGEAGLLVVAVALTGFLVNTSPRPEAAAGTAAPADAGVEQATAGEYQVLASLSPGRQGPNTLLLQVQDATGEPLEVFSAPEVSVGNGEVDLGLVPLRPVGAGTYSAELVLPTAGEWEAQVSLRATEFDNPVTILTLTAR
ncbi:copper resistance protein CopC [Nocardioides nanhaiensis]|uniref:Copper resistance protein CopC n=1 Tax=Nocardioides nanhaiensis TaxID=1476871 RepID=A0ABP8WUR3_9ACTN